MSSCPLLFWKFIFAMSLLAAATGVHAADWPKIQETAATLSPRAEKAVKELRLGVHDWKARSERDLVDEINGFYNERISFTSDLESTGEIDRWFSPLESLTRGQGDCEDYAIAKFFTLIAAGVHPDKLRMVYVRANVLGTAQAHMVAVYRPTPEAEPLVLDNLSPLVLHARSRPDLAPVFSFGLNGLWEGATGNALRHKPLSKWQVVMHKARAEGFLD